MYFRGPGSGNGLRHILRHVVLQDFFVLYVIVLQLDTCPQFFVTVRRSFQLPTICRVVEDRIG